MVPSESSQFSPDAPGCRGQDCGVGAAAGAVGSLCEGFLGLSDTGAGGERVVVLLSW